jgi:hypothetical protein
MDSLSEATRRHIAMGQPDTWDLTITYRDGSVQYFHSVTEAARSNFSAALNHTAGKLIEMWYLLDTEMIYLASDIIAKIEAKPRDISPIDAESKFADRGHGWEE